jgi:hypothetical protein
MPMNYRRGFRRIGLVAWILYSAFVLSYPYFDTLRERNNVVASDYAVWRTCPPGDNPGACNAELKSSLDTDYRLYDPISQYKAMGWGLLWMVPVVLLVPPAIFYWMTRGLSSLCRWLVSGFKTPGAQI